MIVCPVCQFRNPSFNTRCLRCTALLAENEEELGRAKRAGEAAAKFQGAIWREALLLKIQRHNPLARLWCMPADAQSRHRFPGAAAALSVVPGLGQVYNGQFGKGLFLSGVVLALTAANVYFIRHPWSNLGLLAWFFLLVYIWADAISSAMQINGRSYFGLWHGLALVFAAMAIFGSIITTTQIFGANLIPIVNVTSDVGAPLINVGDAVFCNGMRYWFGAIPRPGHLVLYDPPALKVEMPSVVGNDLISINSDGYFQYCTTGPGPGMVTVLPGGELYFNGAPMPPPGYSRLVGAECLTETATVRLEADEFFLPITRIPQGDFLRDALGLGSPAPARVFQPGYIWQNWHLASRVKYKYVYARAVAIVNPPERRRWL